MPCCPYGKRPLLISAQVLAGTALIFSLSGYWLTWLLGIASFIMLMCGACCRIQKFEFIIGGVLAGGASIGQIVFATLVSATLLQCPTDDYYGNNCNVNVSSYRYVAITSAVLWGIVCATTFAFVCRSPPEMWSEETWSENERPNTREDPQSKSESAVYDVDIECVAEEVLPAEVECLPEEVLPTDAATVPHAQSTFVRQSSQNTLL